MREHSLELVGVGKVKLWVGAAAVVDAAGAAGAAVDVTVVECAVLAADQHIEFLVALKRAAAVGVGVC